MSAILLTLALAGRLDAQPTPRQLRIDVAVYKGDPLGSKAEGNVKSLAEPSLVAFDGQSATFMAGSEGNEMSKPYGVKLAFWPTRQTDGTIRLVMATTLSEPCGELGIQAGGKRVPGVTERTYRYDRVVKAGEKFRVRLAADSPASQTWAEVTVRDESR
jgi:hypothetical protein